MAQIRSSRWWVGLTAALAAAFLAAVYGLTFWGWSGGTAAPYVAPPRLEPSAVPSASPSAVVHPAALPSSPLTESALESIGPGWVLVEYDSSAGAPDRPLTGAAPTTLPDPSASAGTGPTAASAWQVIGPTYLYAVDPSGSVYAAGDLGVATGSHVVAWLPDHRTAVVSTPQGAGVTLWTLDLLTGARGAPFAAPAGGGVWIAPRVDVARAGDHLLIATGGTSRSLVVATLAGEPLVTAVASVAAGAFLEGPNGNAFVASERVTSGTADHWTIAIYSTTDPSALGPFIRVDQQLPAAEERCMPALWAPDRQLLVTCPTTASSTSLYTLAPDTSTYVQVAILPVESPGDAVAVSADGTRIAAGTQVYSALGTPVWSLPSDGLPPMLQLWTGQIMVVAVDTTGVHGAGYGATELRGFHERDGAGAYVVEAIPGAAGFGWLVPATG